MSTYIANIAPLYYIGIDPGVINGFALLNKETKEYDILKSLSFWELIEWVETVKAYRSQYKIFIEDPNCNKPTFQKSGADNIRKLNKVSQNIGGNKAYATLLIEYFERNGFDVVPIRPRTSKWDSGTLQKYTGITKRTSQHTRDAIKLIHGI